jgi:hypothetical protein
VLAGATYVVRRLGTAADDRGLRVLTVGATALALMVLTAMLVLRVRLSQDAEDVLEAAFMIATSAVLLVTTHHVARRRRRRVIASPDHLGVVLGAAVLFEILREVPETGVEIVDAAGTNLMPNVAAMLAGMVAAAGVAVALALALARVRWRYARPALLLGMAVLGAGLSSRAVEELASAGLVAVGPLLWDLSEALEHSHGIGRWLRMFTGYSDRPGVAEGLAWAGYVVAAASIVGRSRPEPVYA